MSSLVTVHTKNGFASGILKGFDKDFFIEFQSDALCPSVANEWMDRLTFDGMAAVTIYCEGQDPLPLLLKVSSLDCRYDGVAFECSLRWSKAFLSTKNPGGYSHWGFQEVFVQ